MFRSYFHQLDTLSNKIYQVQHVPQVSNSSYLVGHVSIRIFKFHLQYKNSNEVWNWIAPQFLRLARVGVPVCSQTTNTRDCWFGQGLWTFVQPISGICFCSWQSTSWLIQSCRCAQWRSCEMRSSYDTLFPILNTLPLLPSISQQK